MIAGRECQKVKKIVYVKLFGVPRTVPELNSSATSLERFVPSDPSCCALRNLLRGSLTFPDVWPDR